MARGHIRKRGDTWELRVSAGSDPGSSRRRVVTRTFRGTKAAAEKELTKLLGELDQGAHRGPDATLGRLLDAWWKHSLPRWEAATRRGYAGHRRAYLDAHKDVRLRDVTPEWLDGLYSSLLAAGGRKDKDGVPRPLSAATVYKVHCMLHDALADAVRWGWLVWNPADRSDPPSVKRRPVIVPARDALAAAVVTVAVTDKDFAAMLHLQAVAGLRRAELLGLRWEDLDGEHLTVRRTIVVDEKGKLVVQDDTKTHRERRLVLDATTLGVLEEHRIRAKDTAALLEVDLHGYLFPSTPESPDTPQRPDQPSQRWRRWRDKLGLEGVKLHAFRHAMVTHLLDQGVPVHDVAARAGHANANVTLAIYTHPTTEGARRAGEAAEL